MIFKDLGAIPALSIRQPWAELVVSGRKTIELRRWETKYRGRVWLHTGQFHDADLDHSFGYDTLFRGGFIGSVILDQIIELDARKWRRWESQHLDHGSFVPGFYGWLFSDPIRFEHPITAPGQRGLYKPPSEHTARLANTLERQTQ